MSKPLVNFKKIGIFGANGRMGKLILNLGQNSPLNNLMFDAYTIASTQVDLIIDFSSAEGTAQLTHFLLENENYLPRYGLISGTTGLTPHTHQKLSEIGNHVPTLWASNFSIGIQALRVALKAISPFLSKYNFSVNITDVHHVHKKDSPSGTALTLQQDLLPYFPGMQINSERTGEVIGDHTVHFNSISETLSVQHCARQREVFAEGALAAAYWLVEKKPPPKLYTFEEYFLARF